MSQAAKAEEPSMEEILASIRRIIADDDASKSAKPIEQDVPVQAAAPRPTPVPPPPAPAPASADNNQDDIDAMLADLEGPAKAEQPPSAAPADVFDLTESMTATASPAADFRTIDGQSDVVFAELPQPVRPLQEDEALHRPAQSAPVAPDPALLSNNARAAVDSAFNSLAHTVLAQNARTLDDIVKEMLRPMLKSWLDDNLPGMVERIVRAEIERVSRGRP
ncbi:MAG TPA: DUF2497 domain-containing protein [Pseudolabrys sp.]|nr:DUF2497 domain-containing protein [Pseudolabrys sp.]